MQVSRSYKSFHWAALILIYLVIIAGSVVRTTGSGMGCPDWPRCFGQWVPPTEEAQLPADIQDHLLEKRIKKAEKFAKLLRSMGMAETADKLVNDPYLRMEEPFNAARTWTEYGNRLVGFLGGNVVLLLFFWTLLRYRKNRKLLILTFLNLVLMGFEGWLGSIVVASNLVPWTITVHLFFALIILGLQIYIIHLISEKKQVNSPTASWQIWLTGISLVIIFAQMFLGTQVREDIDALIRDGIGQNLWSSELGLVFFIHRSFSWLVLVLLAYMAYKNEKGQKNARIRLIFALLAVELVSGVSLAYLDLPGVARVIHLLFASMILGLLWKIWLLRKQVFQG